MKQQDPNNQAEQLLTQWRNGTQSFPSMDLAAFDLSNQNLTNIDLNHSKGVHVNFSGATLDGANLSSTALRDANLDGASMIRTNLLGAALPGASLVGANLTRAYLHDASAAYADFTKACLRDVAWGQAVLTGAKFCGANLCAANLLRADLRGAELSDADITDVSFERADLRRACLKGAHGFPANALEAQLDVHTYQNSCWSPDMLVRWRQLGATILNLDEFPDDARRAVLGSQPGLTLHFTGLLNRFDSFLIEGVIVSLLGRETDCRIAEFQAGESSSAVRLSAGCLEDLIRVAEVLSNWQPPASSSTDITRFADVLATSLLPDIAALLDDRMDRIELLALPEQVTEMFEDQAQAFITKKDFELVQTGGQKLMRHSWKRTASKVLGGLDEEVTDAVKGWMPGEE